MPVAFMVLSDIHYAVTSDYETYNRAVVVEALLNDIRSRTQHSGVEFAKLDFAVVAGDLAFAGGRPEYDMASTNFLTPLCEAAGLDGEPSSKLFAVPGNHDVNLKGGIHIEQVTGKLNLRDEINEALCNPRTSSLITERQKGYYDFFRELFPGLELRQPGLFYVAWPSTGSKLALAVVGLNSAWLARGGRADQGRLAVGEAQVDAALKMAENAQLRIAILHHPPNWLMQEDVDSSWLLMRRGFHIVIHGHTHRPGLRQEIDVDGETMVIPVGSAYDQREFPNGYAYVSLDPESGQALVKFRRWNPERREWQDDTLSTGDGHAGRVTVRLPRKPNFAGAFVGGAAAQVADALEAVGPPTRGRWMRVASLRPNARPNTVTGRTDDVARVGKMLAEHGTLVLCGMPGIGKSTVASQYISQAEENAKASGEDRIFMWLTIERETELIDIVGTALEQIGRTNTQLELYSPRAQAELLLDELRSQEMVLVLDQAEFLLGTPDSEPTEQSTMTMLEALATGVGQSRVLLVSRVRIATERGFRFPYIQLEGLSVDNSVALLRGRGAAGSLTQLREVAVRLGGHPLALVLVAQSLSQAGSVDQLLQDVRTWRGESSEIATRILASAYREMLSEEERCMLGALCVLRLPASIDAVSFVAGRESSLYDAGVSAVHRLAAGGILSMSGGFFWPHPLAREYVSSILTDAKPMHERAAEFYYGLSSIPGQPHVVSVPWLLEAFQHALAGNSLPLAVKCLSALSDTLLDHGATLLLVSLCYGLISKHSFATELSAAERAKVLGNYGRALRGKGQPTYATAVYREALRLANEAHDEHLEMGLAVNLSAALPYDRAQEAETLAAKAARYARRAGDRWLEGEALANQGMMQLRLGRVKEAEQSLRAALEINREVSDYRAAVNALIAIAHARELQNDPMGAEVILEEALNIARRHQLPRGEALSLANLGLLLERNGFIGRAIERLREAIRIWRKMPLPEFAWEVLFQLAGILVEVGHIEGHVACLIAAKELAATRGEVEAQPFVQKADEVLERAKARGDDYAEIVTRVEKEGLKALDRLLTEPLPDLGIVVLQDTGEGEMKSVPDFPRDPRYWHDLGAVYAMESTSDHDRETAEKLLRAYIDRQPDAALPYTNLGLLLFDLGRAEEADSFLRRGIDLEPENSGVLAAYGYVLMEQQRWREAVSHLQAAIEHGSKELPVLLSLAISCRAIEDWPGTVAAYEQILAHESLEGDHIIVYARALWNVGRLDDAESTLQDLLGRCPGDASAIAELGLLLIRQETPKKAVDLLEEALAKDDWEDHQASDLHNAMGFALSELGRRDDALESFKKASRLAPGAAWTLHNKGVVLQELDRRKEAETAYRRCLEVDPKYWRARVNLAELLFDRGARQEALRHAREAVELMPSSSEAREILEKIRSTVGVSASSQKRKRRVKATPKSRKRRNKNRKREARMRKARRRRS